MGASDGVVRDGAVRRPTEERVAGGAKQIHMTAAMAAAILALPGCEDPEPTWQTAQTETAICTTQSGERVDDDLCGDDYDNRGSNGFLWYFIGRGSRVPYYYDSVRDPRYRGSYQRSPTVTYARAPASTRVASPAVSRGGFGSSARSYGGGGRS